MPEIRIAFELPAFTYSYTWTDTAAEAAELLDGQAEIVAKSGYPPEAFFRTLIVQAPEILRSGDEDSVLGWHAMLTAWALQLPAGHPDLPGRMIDWLPTYDFELTLTRAEPGKLIATVAPQERDDFAGSA